MQIHEISFSDHSKIKKNVAKTRFDDKTCACCDTILWTLIEERH